MRLTIEENRDAIRRYDHVRPARGRSVRRCAIRCPGTQRTCTLERGHHGPHVAHGALRRVVAVWDGGSGGDAGAGPSPPVAPARREGAPARRPVGLPTRSPVGALERAKGWVAALIGSWDQVAFVLLFIVFVRLMLDVLKSLY